MPSQLPVTPRGSARDRHGRGPRSSVTGPHLPMLHNRTDRFERIVLTTMDYLRELWPELAGVHIDVVPAPEQAIHGDHIDRWQVDHATRRIVLFRLPITQFSRLTRDNDLHDRIIVESYVLQAVAELVGRDPWDLAPPDRF